MSKNSKLIGTQSNFVDEVIKALKYIVQPVAATLGPDGLPILIDRPSKPPIMTKDGVSVAESIFVSNPIHESIIQLVKEAAQKTNESVGDGTTSAIVLTNAIIQSGFKYIKAGVISPQKLVSQIKSTFLIVRSALESFAIPITNEAQIKHVAMISSNADEEVASMVTEAVVRSGVDGIVMLEDGHTHEIVVRHIEGYQVGRGWSAHKHYAGRMLLDKQRQETVFSNSPNVLLYDGEFNDIGEFTSVIMAHFGISPASAVVPTTLKQLVVVAHSFSGQIRQLVADNMATNGLPIMLVETEVLGTPNSQVLMIEDLAVYTSGLILRQGHSSTWFELIDGVKYLRNGVLGKCDKVKQSKNVTTFFNNDHSSSEFDAHIAAVKKQIEDSEYKWDEQIHRKRVAKLLNGIVTVEVGGITAIEAKERKDRVEDALNATKAAMKRGVVPGGGAALLKCYYDINQFSDDDDMSEQYGRRVFMEVLQSTMRQIVINTGGSPDVVIETLLANHSETLKAGGGYDALSRKIIYKSIVDHGIIDPLAVVIESITNAVSVGCEILRGGGYCVFTRKQEEEEDLSQYMPQPDPDNIA